MVIIITGPSHTGKTFLAQKLLEKYKYPYLSIDHLKMGLIRSGNCDISVYDDSKLTSYLYPIVKEIIKTAIENMQNLIIEGCYIPFNYQDGLEEKYLENIKLIALAFSDSYIDNNFDKIIKYESVIEKRYNNDKYTKEDIKKDNHLYIQGFKDNVKIISGDYKSEINKIIDEIFML